MHISRLRRALLPLVATVAALTLTVSACGGGDDGSAAPGGTTQVDIGVTPYFEYQPWKIAHELGLDREQGLDFKFTSFTSDQVAALALARGTIDLASSCHACDFPLFKSLPTLQDFMITNQFKGFILIGRKGETPTYDELVKTKSPQEAKEEVLTSLKGKTFTIHKASYQALLEAALGQIGLGLADIKITDLADDTKAALAFARGEGDFYIGGLPQEANLLNEPDKYVNVGGTDILGPAGLWYSTMISTSTWLDANKDVALKTMAVWYRTMRYLDEQPDKTIPMFTAAINAAAGLKLTDDQVKYITSELETYATLPVAKERFFDPDSELYFQQSVEFYQKGNAEVLPAGFDASKSIVNTAYFDALNADADLVKWIESPLS